MREYVTEALVLGKEPLRAADGRYHFFTRRFGKMAGKATSSRKITSKLAGHLEPGSFANVRFVERNSGTGGSAQIADALQYGKAAAPPRDLELLWRVLAEGEADEALWQEVSRFGASPSWTAMLAFLGWDPREAGCAACSRGAPAAFLIPRQEFFCNACASKLERDDLILM